MDNLDSQQKHLASSDYDLRITNLARFIYRKIGYRHPDENRDPVEIPDLVRDDKPVARDDKVRLLDVGAGNGLLLKFFKQKGFAVAGVELSQELVEKMKRDPQLKDVSIRSADITQLTGNEEYEVVICNDVIEHIEDDKLALRNLFSFVKKNGLLVVSIPAHSFLYGKRDKAWGHFRRYDKTMLLERVEKLNGTVLFVTFWNIVGFFVYFLFEKILKKPINEEMRYSSSPVSKIVRWILDMILRVEELIGGLPLGLTLVVGIKKDSV